MQHRRGRDDLNARLPGGELPAARTEGRAGRGRLDRRLLARVLFGGVAVLAGAAFSGWLIDPFLFEARLAGATTMKANTALGLLLLAVAGLARTCEGTAARLLGTAAAGLALAIAGLSLAEHLGGWDLGIDQLVARDPTGDPYPGRPAPHTAACLAMLAGALLAIEARGAAPGQPTPAEHLAVAAAAIAFLAALGRVYGVRPLYSYGVTSMALQTAVSVVALALGTLALRPTRGLTAVFTEDSDAGRLARRLVPATLAALSVGGALQLGLERSLGLERGAATALFVLGAGGVLLRVIWVTTRAVAAGEAEREGVSRSLRDSEARLRILLEHAPAALALLDREMRYLAVSERWCRDYDLDTTWLLGRSVYDSFPGLPEEWRHKHQRALAGEVLSAERQRFVRPDGRFRWTRWELRPWRAGGAIAGIVIFTEDITQRVLAEDALRDRERLLELAIRGANLGTWDWDLQRDRLAWSARSYELLCPDGKGLLTYEGFLATVAPEHRARVDAHARAAVRDHAEYEEEFFAHRTGRWVAARGRVLYDERTGEPVRMTGVVADMTERKQLELQQRRDMDELERVVEARTSQLRVVNAELEAFSYSVAHDLRAPLRHVRAHAELLLETAGPQLDAGARTHAERVILGTGRMGQLIDGLLELSRAARQPLEPEAVDLAALARDVVQGLRAEAPDRDVEWVLPERLEVRGDPRMLRVVLENLLENAWKYTGDRSGARVELGERRVDGARVFHVRDNGIGFDPADRETLFRPFARLEGGRRFPGTGIGLATVQRVVARHGGRVWAEGERNGGATIFFTLWTETGAGAP